MEDRSGKGEVNLSVDHPDKILELGDSIDIGKCKETKKDGSGCTNLVSGLDLTQPYERICTNRQNALLSRFWKLFSETSFGKPALLPDALQPWQARS